MVKVENENRKKHKKRIKVNKQKFTSPRKSIASIKWIWSTVRFTVQLNRSPEQWLHAQSYLLLTTPMIYYYFRLVERDTKKTTTKMVMIENIKYLPTCDRHRASTHTHKWASENDNVLFTQWYFDDEHVRLGTSTKCTWVWSLRCVRARSRALTSK